MTFHEVACPQDRDEGTYLFQLCVAKFGFACGYCMWCSEWFSIFVIWYGDCTSEKGGKRCIWRPLDIKFIWPLEEISGASRTATEIAKYHWVRGQVIWKCSLNGSFQDTVNDITRHTIFIPRSCQMDAGQSLSVWVATSLNYDRYQLRWKLERMNVRCSCLILSVHSHNPANSSFWKTYWASKLAKRSTDRSRSTRNVMLNGTCLYALLAGISQRYCMNSMVFHSQMYLKLSRGRDYII